jgi:hypothetical protein
MRYKEVVIGNLTSRGNLYTIEECGKLIEQLRAKKTEYYTSVFYFDYTAKEYVDKQGTIAKYSGKVGVDELVFDIDIKHNTDEYVLEEARKFVLGLIYNWELNAEEIEIWYSGRGYHIYINDYFNFGFGDIIDQIKNTIKEHFPDVDTSIYKRTGLIRGRYSYNSKSGRYKIPLTYNQFMKLTASEIIELSKDNTLEVEFKRDDYTKDWSKRKVSGKVEISRSVIDEPTRIVTCMQKLYLRGQQVGRRNTDLLRLASAWRRQGLHKQTVIDILVRWADTLNPDDVVNIVNRVYEVGYKYGCSDRVMSEFCDPKCIYFSYKNYDSKVIQGSDVIDMVKDYYEFIQKADYLDISTMFELDKEVRIYPGEYLVLFGDTKLGKSTVVNNIVLNNKHLKWLVLPLENGIPLEVKRFIQIENNCSEQEAYDIILKRDSRIDFLKKINFYDKSMTIDDLYKFIVDSDANAIVIDTVDQISVNRDDYTNKTEVLSTRIRDIVNQLKRIVILVHHISKKSIEDMNNQTKTLTIHSGKGSSSIEQKANYVISVEGNRNSNLRYIRALGGRDKDLFEIKTVYDPVTKRIRRYNEL